MIDEQGKCDLTIKEAFYARGVNVSGNKTDGYFISFVEDVKDMVVNSGNRKTIARIVKMNKNCSVVESRNIGNWAGTTISLFFDPTVKMKGKTTGGIRVKPKSPIPDISDKKAISILSTSKTIDELKSNWSKLSKNEQALSTVNKVKDELKNKLSND